MFKKLCVSVAAAIGLVGAAVAQETIKVGMITVDGGPFAFYNTQVTQPVELAVETLNARGGALGRKYELVQQTHAGTPAGFVAAATKLVQQQGVQFIMGLTTSSLAAALAPKISGLGAIYIDSGSALEDLIGKNCQPNYFRISTSDTMMANNLRAAVKSSGNKTWNLFMADYNAGHEYAKTFTALVQELGGTVQTTLFAPLSTTDFGSFISQLSAKPADGLAVFYPGSNTIAFMKQQQQFGLFQKFKTVLSWNTATEVFLPAMGDAASGLYSATSYAWDQPGAANAAFVKAFEAKYKRKPVYGDADNYMVFELLHAAIVKAKSTDVPAVRAALAGLKINAVGGEIEMRAADHQALRSMVVTQAVKGSDGNLTFTTRSLEPAAKIAPPVNPECKMM